MKQMTLESVNGCGRWSAANTPNRDVQKLSRMGIKATTRNMPEQSGQVRKIQKHLVCIGAPSKARQRFVDQMLDSVLAQSSN